MLPGEHERKGVGRKSRQWLNSPNSAPHSHHQNLLLPSGHHSSIYITRVLKVDKAYGPIHNIPEVMGCELGINCDEYQDDIDLLMVRNGWEMC